MRLPLQSWKETLSTLGLRWVQKPQPRKRRRDGVRLSIEPLEQRQMLSANVLDDADTDYAEIGSWSNVGSGYASESRYTASTSNTASWTFESMTPGRYEFFTTYTADGDRTDAAEYAIYDDATLLDTVEIDQQASPDDETYDGVEWESLGIFTITEETVSIELSNDVSSTKLIADAVRWEAVPELPLKLDFGTGSVESGFDAATDSTVYTPQAGYGWTAGQSLSNYSGSGTYLLQDFVHTSSTSLTFVARVADGDYDVTLGWGAYHYSTLDEVEVSLEGAAQEEFTLDSGEAYANVYRVTVTDGLLNIDLADLGGSTYLQLNYLEITDATDPPAPTLPLRLDLGSYSTASGFTQATHETLYSPTYGSPTGYGWTIAPTSSSTGGSWSNNYLTYDFVYTNEKSMTFVANVADGDYDVTLGWGGYHSSTLDNIDVHIEGELLETVTPGSNRGYANTYRVSVSDGHLTLHLSDQDSTGYIQLNYLEIQEAADPIAPTIPLKLDFGPDSGSPESGYTAASEYSTYTGQAGYGWAPSSQQLSSYNSYSGSNLLQDFVYTSDSSLTFLARLEDGDYDVILGWGPYHYSTLDGIEVSAEGLTLETFSLASSEAYANVYRVTVTDGMLNLQLADVSGSAYLQLNYLEIKEAVEPPSLPLRLDFGNYNTAYGFTQVTHETLYSPSYGSPTGYGWTIAPLYSGTGGSSSNYLTYDYVYTNNQSMVFVAAVEDGEYDVTLGWGAYHYSVTTLDDVQVRIEGEVVDTVTLDSNEGYANTYRVSVADGRLTIHLSDQGGLPFIDLAYLEIEEAVETPPPGLPLRVDFGTDSGNVEYGYVGATENTNYTGQTGYGLIPSQYLSSYNYSSSGSSYLLQDFVYTNSYYDTSLAFQARVPDGDYDVILGWGSYHSSTLDNIEVRLEDVAHETISLDSGEGYANVYRVSVTDGMLNLELADLGGTTYIQLNYLEIHEAIEPPTLPLHLDFGSYSTASGFTSATHETRYSPSYGSPGGYGWVIPPAYSSTGGSSSNYLTYDFVYTNDKAMTFVADVADGDYDVTLGWGAHHSSTLNNIEVQIEGETRDLITALGNYQGYANTYRVSVTDGHLTLHLADRDYTGYVDLAYLEIVEATDPPPSLPLKLDFGPDYGSVESGYTGASDNTIYTSLGGFGWVPNYLMYNYNGGGGSYLTQDFVYTTSDTPLAFLARVENGEYDVTLGWGPYRSSTLDSVEVSLEGVPQEMISLGSSEDYENTYRIRVTDGVLNLKLNDLGGASNYIDLAYLEIASAVDPPVATGAHNVLLVKDGDPASFNLGDWFHDHQDAAEDLTFTIQSNSNPSLIGASITGGVLQLTPGSTLGSATITLRATDLGSLYGEATITVGTYEPDEDLESSGGGPLLSLPWGQIDDENTGALVSDLIAGLVNTSNPTGLGMAIYGAAAADLGDVQFSLDGGETWEDVGAVSPTAALLLPANEDTRLRFLPVSGQADQILSAATSIIQFVGWNESVGTAGQTLDLTHASNQAAVAPAPNDVRVQQTMQNLEFVVNTTTYGDQYYSKVAMAPDGRSVVAWVSNSSQGEGIYAQRFNADGTRLGNEFLVASASSPSYPALTLYLDDVAIDSGNTFVIVTEENTISSTTTQVRRFTWDTAETVGTPISFNDIYYAHIDTDMNGDLLVVARTQLPSFSTVKAGVYDVNQSLLAESTIYTASSDFIETVGVAIASDNTIVVAWNRGYSSPHKTELVARRFAFDGDSIDAVAALQVLSALNPSTHPSMLLTQPSVEMNASKEAMVFWGEHWWGSVYDNAFKVAIVGTAGTATASQELAKEPGLTTPYRPYWISAHFQDDGKLLAVGTAFGEGSDINAVGQYFEIDGSPVGQRFDISNLQAGYYQEPGVAGDGKGGVLVAWDESGSEYLQPGRDGIDSAVVARFFGETPAYSVDSDSVGFKPLSIYTRPISVEVATGHVVFHADRGPDGQGDGIIPVYRQTNDRHPIVSVDYVVPQSVPEKLEVRLTLGGISNTLPVFYSLSGASAGQVVRLAVQADNVGELPTGRYNFQIEVKEHRGGVIATPKLLTGATDLVNRRESEFGVGWWLDSLDRIVTGEGDYYKKPYPNNDESYDGGGRGVLLVRGDGTTGWFAELEKGDEIEGEVETTYRSPAGSFTKLTRIETIEDDEVTGTRYELKHTDGTVDKFTVDGLLDKRVDRNGNVIDYEYDVEDTNENSIENELLTITDIYGLTTTYAYAGGYLDSVTDFADRVTDFQVGTTGVTTGYVNKIVETDSDGAGELTAPETDLTWNVNYHEDYFDVFLSSVTTPGIQTESGISRPMTWITYSAQGRFESAYSADYSQWKLTPAQVVGLASSSNIHTPAAALTPDKIQGRYTNERDQTWTYTVDRFGYQTAMTDPLSHTWTYSRDTDGLTRRMTEPAGAGGTANLGALVTSYRYDDRGNLLRATYAQDKLLGGGKITETWEYDEQFSQVTRHVDARGYETLSELDTYGNAIEVHQQVDIAADPYEDEETEGWITTKYHYTGDGEITPSVELPGGLVDLVTDPRGIKTRTIYYINGNEGVEPHEHGLVKSIRAGLGSGEEQTGTVDGIAINASITHYQYDAARNVNVVIQQMGNLDPVENEPTGEDDTDRYTRYEYDQLNRLIEVQLPEADHVDVAGEIDHFAPTTVYAYDKEGSRKKQTDALGRETEYAYDLMGRLKKTTLPESQFYNAANPASPTTAKPTIVHVYDYAGNLESVTDANGNTSYNFYTARNEVSEAWLPATADHGVSITRYAYDSAGNLKTVRDALDGAGNRETSYEYDSLHRNTKITRPSPGTHPQSGIGTPHAAPFTITVYDDSGNVVEESDGLLRETSYIYDGLNRLTRTTLPMAEQVDAAGDPFNDTPIEVRKYDAAGNLVRLTDPKQFLADSDDEADNETDYKYDSMNRRIEMEAAPTNQYRRNSEGAVVSLTAHRPKTTRQYNDAGQLVREIGPLDAYESGRHTTIYQYDALGRLVLEKPPQIADPVTHSLTDANTLYEYDGVGNLRYIEHANGATEEYRYDALDRKTAYLAPLALNYDPLHGEADADGMRNFTAIVNYQYDLAGQLRETKDPLGEVTRRDYDEQGRLIRETLPEDEFGIDPVYEFHYDAVGNLRSKVVPVADLSTQTTDYDYDNLNRRVKIQEASATQVAANGSTSSARPTTYTVYDIVGRVVGVTDAREQTTNTEYDDLNRVKEVTAPLLDGEMERAATQYQYDVVGNLRLETDTRDNVTEYVLDNLYRVTQVLAAQASHLMPTGVVAAKAVTELRYDPAGRKLQSIDALGTYTESTTDRITDFHYDDRGRLVKVELPSADHVTPSGDTASSRPLYGFTYDLVGNKVAETDALGKVTRFEYDAQNRLVKQLDPQNHPDLSTGTLIDDDNDMDDAFTVAGTWTTDSLNGYLGDQQHLLGTYGNTGFGHADWEFDSLEVGKKYRVYATWKDDAANATGARFKIGDGEYIIVNQNDAPVGPTFDGVKWQLLGEITAADDTLNILLSDQTTESGGGRVVADGVILVEIPEDEPPTTTFRYDATGQLRQTVDPLGRTTTQDFDKIGRLIHVTDPDPDGPENAPQTHFIYDLSGNLQTRTQILGADDDDPERPLEDLDDLTEVYEYDALFRLDTHTDGNGDITHFAYDIGGNQRTMTDPAGNVTTYHYDAWGRMVHDEIEVDSFTLDRFYTFDHEGNLTEKVDRNGRTTQFDYDAMNRRIEERWYDGLAVIGNLTNSVYTSYDIASRLVAESDSFSAYQYTFDDLDRVVGIANFVDLDGDELPEGGDILTPNAVPVWLTQGFDELGRRRVLRAEIFDTGLGAWLEDFDNTYQYNSRNQLEVLVQQAGLDNAVAYKRVELRYNPGNQLDTIRRYESANNSQLAASSSYFYDDTRRLSSLAHNQGENALAMYVWTYDDASRVKTFTSEEDGVATYGYDNRGQLVDAVYADYGAFQRDEHYDYDSNGNRTQVIFDEGELTEETQDYDTPSGSQNRISTDGTYAYEFDDQGNRIRKTHLISDLVTVYAWDVKNRLVKVTEYASTEDADEEIDPTLVVENTYDMHGRWIGRQVDTNGDATVDQTDRFVYDGKQIVLRFSDDDSAADDVDNLKQRYLWANAVDHLFAQEDVDDLLTDGRLLWALGDNLGSIRDMVEYNDMSEETTVANHVTYDSFGVITDETQATPVDQLFYYTARPQDTFTGLQNNWYRWYDAPTGQWASPDPIEDDVQNSYRYVGNSPTNWTDPMGLAETHPVAMNLSPRCALCHGDLQGNYKNIASGFVSEDDVPDYQRFQLAVSATGGDTGPRAIRAAINNWGDKQARALENHGVNTHSQVIAGLAGYEAYGLRLGTGLIGSAVDPFGTGGDLAGSTMFAVDDAYSFGVRHNSTRMGVNKLIGLIHLVEAGAQRDIDTARELSTDEALERFGQGSGRLGNTVLTLVAPFSAAPRVAAAETAAHAARAEQLIRFLRVADNGIDLTTLELHGIPRASLASGSSRFAGTMAESANVRLAATFGKEVVPFGGRVVAGETYEAILKAAQELGWQNEVIVMRGSSVSAGAGVTEAGQMVVWEDAFIQGHSMALRSGATRFLKGKPLLAHEVGHTMSDMSLAATKMNSPQWWLGEVQASATATSLRSLTVAEQAMLSDDVLITLEQVRRAGGSGWLKRTADAARHASGN
ncbi:MAG: hypothetical protein K8T91_10750 [Planctomycetes bacterium]|nr:hypothetical protein [Planctomycetota bacterium]